MLWYSHLCEGEMYDYQVGSYFLMAEISGIISLIVITTYHSAMHTAHYFSAT